MLLAPGYKQHMTNDGIQTHLTNDPLASPRRLRLCTILEQNRGNANHNSAFTNVMLLFLGKERSV